MANYQCMHKNILNGRPHKNVPVWLDGNTNFTTTATTTIDSYKPLNAEWLDDGRESGKAESFMVQRLDDDVTSP